MRIRLWGTRGSIPTPGPDTVKYGGNTPCVEVRCGKSLIILDAGSGIRLLGNHIQEAEPERIIDAHILISHTHWDHIQGFPFFSPAYQKKNRLTIHGCNGMHKELEDLLAGQMADDYFPVGLEMMAASKEFHILGEERFSIDEANVESQFVHHTARTLAYRIEHRGSVFCYVTDNEPQYYVELARREGPEAVYELLPEIEHGGIQLGERDRSLIDFVRGADLLVHDSQYGLAEYRGKIRWGHSFFHFAIEIALQAGVGHLLLFHHDPMHDDLEVDRKAEAGLEYVARRGGDLKCEPAREGLIIEL